MSTQIAVRLPDDMVRQMDAFVAAGAFARRTGFVEAAVEREFRRLTAEADARTLRAQGAGDDLDDLVSWTAAHTDSGD